MSRPAASSSSQITSAPLRNSGKEAIYQNAEELSTKPTSSHIASAPPKSSGNEAVRQNVEYFSATPSQTLSSKSRKDLPPLDNGEDSFLDSFKAKMATIAGGSEAHDTERVPEQFDRKHFSESTYSAHLDLDNIPWDSQTAKDVIRDPDNFIWRTENEVAANDPWAACSTKEHQDPSFLFTDGTTIPLDVDARTEVIDLPDHGPAKALADTLDKAAKQMLSTKREIEKMASLHLNQLPGGREPSLNSSQLDRSIEAMNGLTNKITRLYASLADIFAAGPIPRRFDLGVTIRSLGNYDINVSDMIDRVDSGFARAKDNDQAKEMWRIILYPVCLRYNPRQDKLELTSLRWTL